MLIGQGLSLKQQISIKEVQINTRQTEINLEITEEEDLEEEIGTLHILKTIDQPVKYVEKWDVLQLCVITAMIKLRTKLQMLRQAILEILDATRTCSAAMT